MNTLDDKKKKLTYEQATKKLAAGLHCGQLCKFYSCFNVHHFQGNYSQGRGYIDNNGYWACSTNCNHGCPDRPKLNDEKVSGHLAISEYDLKRKDLIEHSEDSKRIIRFIMRDS